MRVDLHVGKRCLITEPTDAGSQLPVHRYQDPHRRIKNAVSRRQEGKSIETKAWTLGIQNLSTGSWQSPSATSQM